MPVNIVHAAETTAQEAITAPKKLFVKSYGCQMNVYDGLRLGELMRPHGYALTESPQDADLIVFNTCHIRDKADEKLFSDIGRFAKPRNRKNKDTPTVAVGGCIGQALGENVMKRAPEVNIVFGPQTYHRLPEFLAKMEENGRRIVDTDLPELEKFDNLPTPGVYGPTAFCTIQEGCDKFCTYCVVPYTRGAEISRKIKDIEEEVKILLEQGAKEICLIGQNVNAFHGVDEKGQEITLGGLIKRIVKLDGLERLRFTTSHPFNMHDELIDLFATEPKLMPYLHLPVQAGSNRILKAMNRTHSAEEYVEIIQKVRAARPDIAISGDFIVGFPGETEDDYLDTLAVAAEVGYATAYSFAYSPRPGTPAAAMTGQVDEAIKKERLAGLQALLDEQQAEFNARFQDQIVEVLVEGDGNKQNQMRGRSPHNVVVNFSVDNSSSALIGDIVRVKITQAKPKSLFGVLA